MDIRMALIAEVDLDLIGPEIHGLTTITVIITTEMTCLAPTHHIFRQASHGDTMAAIVLARQFGLITITIIRFIISTVVLAAVAAIRNGDMIGLGSHIEKLSVTTE